ncbi:MAG: family efflux transporter [Myxococcaceae bacterium]|nr:family efflux transporter [Myxococcaceae bacterium]
MSIPGPAASRPARPLLTEGHVGRTLIVFSLPILLTNVLQSLNGSVNSIWVGRYLGSAALTATSNANTIMFFLIGIVFGVAMAASILVGQSIGAQDVDQAKRVVGTSASFFILAALGISAVGFFFSPQLLSWMHTPADALPYAIAYLRVIFVGMPFIFVYAFVTIVLRGAGDARTPLLFSLLSVGLDIVLNPLLIFGVGPLPKLGIAGAATATLIANGVTLVAIMIHLYRRKHFLCLRGAELAYLRPDRALLGALVKKGLPMGMQMIVMTSSAIVMMSLVNGFGTATSAAFGAALQLWNYIQMPAFAIGMAASAMAAQNVGAGRWDRVSRIALAGVGINFLMTGTLAAIIYMFDRSALGLFLTDPAAIAVGTHLNAIVVWSFTFFGISMVLSSVVRSTGAVIPPLLILFVSLWVLRIPFAVALLRTWGADAIWWSFPLGSLASVALSLAYYRFGAWRTARMLSSEPARASAA